MSEQEKELNPIDENVGGRVKAKRQILGMSQEKLGESLGVTFQQVQKYERGINRISVSTLMQICSVLKEPPSFFLNQLPGTVDDTLGSFAESGSEYTADFFSSPEQIQLNRSFLKIRDPKVRKHIINLVKSLADEAD